MCSKLYLQGQANLGRLPSPNTVSEVQVDATYVCDMRHAYILCHKQVAMFLACTHARATCMPCVQVRAGVCAA